MAAAEFLAEAERQGVTSALCLSHRTLGTTYFTMGEFEAGRRHLEQARALYNPELESESLYQYGQDIGATALCYLCWALWQLGYVDQATEVAAEAVKHAEALSHFQTAVAPIYYSITAELRKFVLKSAPRDAGLGEMRKEWGSIRHVQLQS